MLRQALLTAAVLIAGPAAAAAGGESKAPKEVGQYVDISPVGLPVVANRQLANYVFVYVRINLTSGANASTWRQKEPYFRDALVRAAHRTPFNVAGDTQVIDTERLSAALMRGAVALTGPGVVRSVVVTSQSPRFRRRTPQPQVAASH
jgi:hypothetical protein